MKAYTTTIEGQIIEIKARRIFPGRITIREGKIVRIDEIPQAPAHYILPGFIDAHVHIESSMLCPSAFGQLALKHGTVATVSDPHEIANVCGLEGIDFMLEDALRSPLKFNFGAPSCVPATAFETAGAVLDAQAVDSLLQRKEIRFLSEMMNFPGVLQKDPEVFSKINSAHKYGKPVDGHAPGLQGEQAGQYAAAGISTDHECTTLAEALDKIEAGMFILIREGSAAKNFDALIELIRLHPGKIMFCSDDKHPDELLRGHINLLVKKAVDWGYDLFDVLHAACVLPVQHYKLEVGLLKVGDPADFILVDDTRNWTILASYIEGVKAEADRTPSQLVPPRPVNHFKALPRKPEDFIVRAPSKERRVKVKIIEALDGQLITHSGAVFLENRNGVLLADPEQDILKIGVLNRYQQMAPVHMGFVRNFGLKKGALASSVAHDSHNIVFVGVDDNSIVGAVNAIIESKGGISVCDRDKTELMPLPIAGLMSLEDGIKTAGDYLRLDAMAKSLGSQLSAPFMTLSFMALPVIPELKITDKGLFDVGKFDFVDL